VGRKVELLAEFDVAAADVADILAAIDLHQLHGFSFWDVLVLRAAEQSVCSALLSEDFQESREVDGVRVVNPFLRAQAIDQQHFLIWVDSSRLHSVYLLFRPSDAPLESKAPGLHLP
jgi:hypothetical protein